MIKRGIMLAEVPFSNSPVIFKSAGLDFFIIDYEHGGFDYSDLSKIIMTAKLCGIDVIVRIPDNTRNIIIKVLDMGANGLLLPMTNEAKDIAQVVEYAKYAPIGKRGISTMRAHTLYNPSELLDYMQNANKNNKVFAQIETKAGVRNVKEILSVSGVDGVMVGPNDLSSDYGCLGVKNSDTILSAIATVAAAATELNKISGIITGNSNYIQKAKESGMSLFSVGSELNALSEYCKNIIKKV